MYSTIFNFLIENLKAYQALGPNMMLSWWPHISRISFTLLHLVGQFPFITSHPIPLHFSPNWPLVGSKGSFLATHRHKMAIKFIFMIHITTWCQLMLLPWGASFLLSHFHSVFGHWQCKIVWSLKTPKFVSNKYQTHQFYEIITKID